MNRNWWKTLSRRPWVDFLFEAWCKNSDCLSMRITQQREIHQESTKCVKKFRFLFSMKNEHFPKNYHEKCLQFINTERIQDIH